ncbi:GNAT family N-acetyltransferase [Legionella maioricensis]|uniref:GNAT family N-acetyltransferase n=1 Tax=Legionella maioricensis TaxID=2896528 RepID=A0A9X2D072_9GAMM|nr:GNAT family N-acetyltransferase [Legionella maioricensis]MCL9683909.1 GNAT family N-acetyltransferase [Legionella maioricensis]MCL9686756.1 GNAT family N-acetyltransferase [Legionella maioricensis]
MSNRIEITDITLNELEQVASTLFDAFKNDSLIQWIFSDQSAYREKGILIFHTWVKYCVLYGKAFRTQNFEAIALRKIPGDTHLTFWRMFRSGMLSTPGILGKQAFNRLMQLDDLTMKERKKNMGSQQYWYCWMLGTKPEYQKKGFGKALMQHTFNTAESTLLPCYLETASESAKQVHIKSGYKILSEITLPESDVQLTSMIRATERKN